MKIKHKRHKALLAIGYMSTMVGVLAPVIANATNMTQNQVNGCANNADQDKCCTDGCSILNGGNSNAGYSGCVNNCES